MQDIVPPEKRRSIRDIPIPENRRKSGNTPQPDIVEDEVHGESAHRHEKVSMDAVTPPPQIHHRPEVSEALTEDEQIEEDVFGDDLAPEEQETHHDGVVRKHYSKKNRYILFAIIGIVLAIILFFVFRTKAVVEVTPKQLSADVNVGVVLVGEDAFDGGSALVYQSETITQSASRQVEAIGEETVTEKATGRITIYNEYSEDSQRLITNTRFESPNGLIYRISESVDVPGYTESANGIVPGQIEVTVTADEAGEDYNIGVVDFTIPGFEGQPQYDSFYAKSVTPMTGGYDGIRKIVEDVDRNAAISALESELGTKIRASIDDKTNDQTLVLADENAITYTVVSEEESGDDVVITVEGRANAYIVDRVLFDTAVAAAAISGFDTAKEQVEITNPDELLYGLALSNGAGVTATVDGTAEFLWITDTTALQEQLAGQRRDELRQILDQFPSVARAEVSLQPFWKQSFPDDASKITVKILASEE